MASHTLLLDTFGPSFIFRLYSYATKMRHVSKNTLKTLSGATAFRWNTFLTLLHSHTLCPTFLNSSTSYPHAAVHFLSSSTEIFHYSLTLEADKSHLRCCETEN